MQLLEKEEGVWEIKREAVMVSPVLADYRRDGSCPATAPSLKEAVRFGLFELANGEQMTISCRRGDATVVFSWGNGLSKALVLRGHGESLGDLQCSEEVVCLGDLFVWAAAIAKAAENHFSIMS
ncbi:MAG TPA: hypothetical protein VFQ60_03990 [Patescibacteria group bacterium]|nr:hypothetical protein [Patescibacteria group bacterium]